MNPSIFSGKLENGLSVFLKEIHSAPIVSNWVWYRVGSRVERTGFTGISHWVEHIQFKGTYNQSGAQMERMIAREGGIWNAFTHLDWTTYYETLPAHKIDLALELEADRMQNSLFDPNDVESERTVILSEKEGKDNEPISRLNRAVSQAAFDFHPYRNEVIGEEADLRRIQRDDLFAHYRRYYQPSNALIAIAGDFDTQEIFQKIQRLYGNIPANGIAPDHVTPEPLMSAKREIEMRGAGDTTYLQLAYRAPAAADPDFFTFTILDSLLTGPASLNMFGGGGTSNKTSRLYQRLVEKELAVSVFGGLQATIDPYIFDVMVIVHPDEKPETVLKQIDAEISRVFENRIHGAEIARAVKQATALFAYGLENITNQAFWMGYAGMFADYGWFTGYLDHLRRTRPSDIRRVAEKYLNPEQRVIGIYIPDGTPEADA